MLNFPPYSKRSRIALSCCCIVADTMKIIHQAHGAKVTLNIHLWHKFAW